MQSESIFLATAVLVIVFFIWKQIQYGKIKKQIPRWIDEGGVIVDVRTAEEFRAGSAKGSINIPLNELEKKSLGLDKNKTIILCCASGIRSGMAVSALKSKGFKNVVNAGAWSNVCQ